MTRRLWRSFDALLLLNVLALVGIGLALIHSATFSAAGPLENLWDDFVFRQAAYALIGLVLMFVVAAVDYRFYQGASRVIYALGIGLLILTFALGYTRYGARRGFDLAFFSVQPSELLKIILILVLAKYLADHQEDIGQLRHFVVSLILILVPMVLVYLQPDLGTAITLGAIWVGVAWAAGIAAWQFGGLGLAGLLAAPSVWMMLKPYMRDRILAFLNPAHDPSGESYNVMQALISIGSGGLWGKGFASGTQSQLHFLRVRHTDFIFSVFAEEFGLVGAIALLVLLAFLLLRILRAAMMARDPYGRLIACGVAMMVFVQAFINLAVNLNVLPATGLPLPFVSYGGSSLLTMFIGIGLVQSVVMRHRKLEFE